MKILPPQYEIWLQEAGELGIYKQIERAGRVCYKSEDHQTEESAKPFVERMINSEHYAMLEHGTVYLICNHNELPLYLTNRFSRCNIVDGKDYITTNLRVLAENKSMGDLQFLSDCAPWHEQRVTVHFTTQISITREYNRHRANSMAEQSTRYCNYSKNKFGNEISVNLPSWVLEQDDVTSLNVSPHSASEGNVYDVAPDDFVKMCSDVVAGKAKTTWSRLQNWVFANLAAEYAYMNLIEAGCKPQEARSILPLDSNTELVHTAFVSDWRHFFDLRALGTTGAPHPDAKILALPLYKEFVKRGFFK